MVHIHLLFLCICVCFRFVLWQLFFFQAHRNENEREKLVAEGTCMHWYTIFNVFKAIYTQQHLLSLSMKIWRIQSLHIDKRADV